MRLARVLGAIGRGLISAGVIVLLFVAYQLWGTGIQNAQAQGNLESDFLELLDSDLAAEVEQLTLATQETATAASADTGASTDDALDSADGTTGETVSGDVADAGPASIPTEVEYSPEFLDVLYPEEGASLARVVIPAINVDQITVEGVSVEDLRKGPGHYPSTPNPGQAGNSAIAGHRTTYGAPFHRVDELVPGDEIIVTTIQGTFTYRVRENVAPDGSIKGHFIVSPSDTWVLGQESGENLLTLTACHPKYSARQRIIVQAELVGEPAATIPRGEDVDFAPVELDAGAADERSADERAEAGDLSDDAGDSGDDVAQVMSDEVAADDDPNVDADGNPIDAAADATTDADGETIEVAAEADATTDAADAEAVEIDEATGLPIDQEAGFDDVDTDDIELTAAQTPFDDDFGEGLNGDPTKIRPAMLWGVAGGAIWLAAWFIGRRLNRKWTLYTIGVVPFLPVLWSCFVNIDQALPSY